MERLQGPINQSILGEHLEVGYLEQLVDAEIRRLEEEKDEQQGPHTSPSLEDKMPFLQMLQSPPFSPFTEPTFQTILKLQRLKKAARPWEGNYYIPTEMEITQIHPLELESCITHELLEMGSPEKSAAKDFKQPHSTSCLEGVSSECNQEQTNSVENGVSGSSSAWIQPQISPNKQTHLVSKSPAAATGRERRKRKRTRPVKNKEEVENQRMTHIAVERNRRRQMNDHLAALRSLMPPSYVQRGDQASIIGGAIDFVKELEQLLQSLQAQKRMRQADPDGEDCANNSSPSSFGVASLDGFPPVQFRGMSSDDGQYNDGGRRGGFTAEKKSDAADIEVTVIQTHVNLKIQCRRRPGQLLKAIIALEDLRLTVLHLNITSLQSSVLYSFNLKIEDDCKMGSADEIAEAVHKIFKLINGGSFLTESKRREVDFQLDISP